MKLAIRNIRHIILLMMVTAFSLEMSAQWNFDIVSVEAYINDHKQQRSLLLARSTLELSNQLLHEYSSEAAVDFKELNVDLDKYTRAFDVIESATTKICWTITIRKWWSGTGWNCMTH